MQSALSFSLQCFGRVFGCRGGPGRLKVQKSDSLDWSDAVRKEGYLKRGGIRNISSGGQAKAGVCAHRTEHVTGAVSVRRFAFRAARAAAEFFLFSPLRRDVLS